MPRQPIDITGQQFGTWTARKPAKRSQGVNGRSFTRWLLECTCRNTTTADTSKLRQGRVCSCTKCGLHPNAIDLRRVRLAGGDVTAIRQLRARTKHSQIRWLCRCNRRGADGKRCGRLFTALVSNLRKKGNTTSCGHHREQSRHWLTKTRIRRMRKEREIVHEDGEHWYSPRAARPYLGWAQIKRATVTYCAWIGRGIRNRKLLDALGQRRTYLAKKDLDAIKDAQAAMPLVPTYPGLIHVAAARQIVGGKAKFRDLKLERVKRPGKRANGMRTQRPYALVSALRDAGYRVDDGTPATRNGASRQPTTARAAAPGVLVGHLNDTDHQRQHRAEAKHLKWKALKDAGRSYNEIVIQHEDDTGEKVSRSAVVMAIQRLQNNSR